MRLLLTFVCGGIFAVFALAYYTASADPTAPNSIEFFKSLANLSLSVPGLYSVLADSVFGGR
jgi:hypothetical protein